MIQGHGLPQSSRARGVALMLVASLSFAGMGALVKVSTATFSFLTVVFVRSLVIVFVTLALVRLRRARLRARNRRLMAWRSATGFTAMCCYFYAVDQLPLSTAITVQYMAPVFVALLSPILLRERVPRLSLVFVFLAFGGAALVLSPEATAFNPGLIAGLTSAVLAAFAYLAVRGLRATDEPETIVLHFSVFSTVAAAPGLLLLDAAPTALELLPLLGVGVFAAGGQLAMTWAFRYADAAYVSAFSYATVVFGAALGVGLFGDPVEVHTLAGTALVVIAGAAISLTARPA